MNQGGGVEVKTMEGGRGAEDKNGGISGLQETFGGCGRV